MEASLALWGAFSVSAGIILWFCPPRWPALPIWVVLSVAFLPATFAPLGAPIPFKLPPGNYTVLGAEIIPEVTIYAFLKDDSGNPPVYYQLPYTPGKAMELQDALDAAQGEQGGVTMEMEEGGEMSFHGPSVQEDQPKQSEQPLMEF